MSNDDMMMSMMQMPFLAAWRCIVSKRYDCGGHFLISGRALVTRRPVDAVEAPGWT